MKNYWFALLGWVLLTVSSVLALDDGLYAVFHTSMGSFTSQLHYAEAPLTVANFVGLAEGSQTWLDMETGAVHQEPFYDGTVFHRVIEGFMIQGGSRNQQGTDGPGYQFPDEIPSGWLHDGAGVLSMANSGYDTNGSQFFVTVGPTAWLDGRHTVFGQVISGMDVVEAINGVPVGDKDKPIDDVTILSIDILRVGAEAEAFDTAGRLPVITEGRIEHIAKVPDGLQMTFNPAAFHGCYIRSSTDLATWSAHQLITYTDHAPEEELLGLANVYLEDKAFYALVDLAYPGNEYAPTSPDGLIFDFEFQAPGNLAGKRVRYAFGDDHGHAVHVNDQPQGNIADYAYGMHPYPHRALLRVIGTALPQIDYRLAFTTATGGAFSGVFHFHQNDGGPEYQASGAFVLVD